MKGLKEKLSGLLSLLLVILYGITVMPIHNHEHSHDHDIEHSKQIHETDQCHNYLYHGDLSSGCEKHDHATKYDIDCLICHHFVSSQKLSSPGVINVEVYFYEETTVFNCTQSFPINSGYTNPLRGPPAIA